VEDRHCLTELLQVHVPLADQDQSANRHVRNITDASKTISLKNKWHFTTSLTNPLPELTLITEKNRQTDIKN